MLIVHHNDLDGYCAGFWAYHNARRKGDVPKLFEFDYGVEFPFNMIQPHESVWILDCSISTKDMVELFKITENVVWIDHHKTSIERYKDFPFAIPGIRYIGLAGCELTYLFIHNDIDGEINSEVLKKIPMFTRLIGDRDTWRKEFGYDSDLFTLALLGFDTNPTSEIWTRLYLDNSDMVSYLIDRGKTLRAFTEKRAERYLKSYGHELTLDGYQCYAINKGSMASDDFQSLDSKIHPYDIYVGYVYTGKIWQVSLRSATVDVSEIAKKRGGGGHKGAARFDCKVLPWMK